MLFCPDYISEVENWMISPSRTLVIIKIADISRTTDLNLDQIEGSIPIQKLYITVFRQPRSGMAFHETSLKDFYTTVFSELPSMEM